MTQYRDAFVVRAGEGDRTGLPLGYNQLKASPEQTGGAFVLREVFHPPGVVAPGHVHANHESCWVLGGEYIFDCEDERLTGHAGDFIFLPEGRCHRFHTGPEGGQMLVLGSPAPFKTGESSLEWRPDYYEELEALLKAGTFTPEARLRLREKHRPSATAAAGSTQHRDWR